MYYLSCWNLYRPEHEMQMWQEYAPEGVAVKTTFGRLRAAVDTFPDRIRRQSVPGPIHKAAEIPMGE